MKVNPYFQKKKSNDIDGILKSSPVTNVTRPGITAKAFSKHGKIMPVEVQKWFTSGIQPLMPR